MHFNPKVSIIIPVYNGSNYLREAIGSALAQTYENIEVIVINDGSCDDGKTEDIAKSFGNRIHYVAKDNGGVASALNMGIRHAQGEYISWLSHDDLYLPDKIKRQVSLVSRQTGNRIIIYGDYEALEVTNGRLHIFTRTPVLFPDGFQNSLSLLFSAQLHGCTLLLPRNCFEEAGFFDERLKTTQDYDLWFKLLKKGYEFIHLPETVVRARWHQDRGTLSMFDIHMEEIKNLYVWAIDLFSQEMATFSVDQLLEIIRLFRHRSLKSTEDYLLDKIQQINSELYSILQNRLLCESVPDSTHWLRPFKILLKRILPYRIFVVVEKTVVVLINKAGMVRLPWISILFHPVSYRLLAKLFRITAETGKGSEICLQEGFLPVPVHFYSPLPDIRDLEKRNVWATISDMAGIDFRSEEQTVLLGSLGEQFGEECRWPLKATDNSSEFYLQNPSFSYGCAASTHCMIRQHKPVNVIEIGSGMSSRVIAAALDMNRCEGHPATYCIVDPYPGDAICRGALKGTELLQSRVELLDSGFFSRLQANDVLFIDSSHSVKTGGDVNYLFLEILPRLAPGVVVHIHDISLPYEYSRAYATSESFRQFWTEQYLLQGFLAFNTEFEVLLAMNYLMVAHSDLFSEAFPFYDTSRSQPYSGSFWIRRKIAGERRV